ncbi:MAG: hypothetical protein VKJ87_03490 [Synechococcus sp.]|nr:hypothetical protein [Synechococcus sp.]
MSTPSRRRPRPSGRLSALLVAALWLGAGTGVLFGLAQLPSRLDTVLFFSTALGNLTTGLIHLVLGVLQLTGALLLLALVSLGLILLMGGLLRMARALGAEAPASIQARMQALPQRRKLRSRKAGPATSYLLNKRN